MVDLKVYLKTISSKYKWIPKCHFYPRLDSTNDEAIRLAKEEAGDGTLVLADEQSRGRGRLGRHWESPSGKGLYFSLVLRPQFPPAQAPLLTLAAGLALGRTLRSFSLSDLVVKWPNDIWIHKRKIAGILMELFTQGRQIDFVILGIGINVTQDPEDFSHEIRKLAGSLKIMVPEGNWDRVEILDKLLPETEREFSELSRKGGESLIRRWMEESGMVGQPVRAIIKGEEKTGTVIGLNEWGHLKIRQNDGEILTLVAEDTTLL